MKRCVFAGTFDPITKGHAFVIEKCLELFDQVVIAIGVNDSKKPMFTLDERKQMIQSVYGDNKKVNIASFDGMLVDFMRENKISVNVRGIRDIDDYKYELTMERYNRDMFPELTTLFIPTPNELVHLSSSAMRSIINLDGNVNEYVPISVSEYINSIKRK